MKFRYETIDCKLLVGICKQMSLIDNKVVELWRKFRPIQEKIERRCNSDLISLTRYPSNYFEAFSPQSTFEKWACVEVYAFQNIPSEMQKLEFPWGYVCCF